MPCFALRSPQPQHVLKPVAQPDNEEFVRLTKEAILEGRKEYQAAQQAEQQQGQGPAASGSKEN